MNKVWIYQTLDCGTVWDEVELFSSKEKAMEKHPGNWVRAEDDVYSKEDKDEPWKDFALWESDID